MAGLGGHRQRRGWQLIGGLCALGIVWTLGPILHGGLQHTDIASLLALPLTVAGLVAAVTALRKPIEGNEAERARAWAATLARQVESGESGVWRQLLGGDTRRINLAYALHSAAVRPATALAAGRLTVGVAGPVTLPDIVTYYRATKPLRLVITGAAGAGKTVLALELLLALIEGRAEDAPVPVRIALSRWDTERQSLPALLEQRLVDAYDWPPALAAGLVRQGMVVPVLDGLDEMDRPSPDGSPDPTAPRATAVIRALNAYQRSRDAGPLILTCRTRHYDALAAHSEILDAARITIAPVSTDDARAYLANRALDVTRWRPLLDHLATHPASAVAATLSTPWRLGLTATVYHHDGDPAELLALPDTDALDHHLLARYIPAATRTVPNPRGYTPQDVHHWLHHLTTHLDPAGTLHTTNPAGAEATDLVLHELWPLAGRRRVRTTDTLLTTLAVLTLLTLARAAFRPTTSVLAIAFGTATSLIAQFATTAGFPTRLHNPLGTPQRRRGIAYWLLAGLTIPLAFGLAAGLMAGLAFGPTFALVFGLVFAIVFGLPLGLAAGLGMGLAAASIGTEQEAGASLSARQVIRSDIVAGLATGLAGGDPLRTRGRARPGTRGRARLRTRGSSRGRTRVRCAGVATVCRVLALLTPPSTLPARPVPRLGRHRRPHALQRTRLPIPPPRTPALAAPTPPPSNHPLTQQEEPVRYAYSPITNRH
ncbi:NACHT domain-containing protein [Streptomyces melanogenes]|uniref:NACHT domain-containing protein n=1 Tax=Streptomyces melanogenes TaxID=67326 RepID=UPI0037B259FC